MMTSTMTLDAPCIASLYAIIPLSGILIGLFTIEQLVNGLRNGFDHPEPPDEDAAPDVTEAQVRAQP
jgi:TRAP-type C4-dicarboxylate transport system permease small subunit